MSSTLKKALFLLSAQGQEQYIASVQDMIRAGERARTSLVIVNESVQELLTMYETKGKEPPKKLVQMKGFIERQLAANEPPKEIDGRHLKVLETLLEVGKIVSTTQGKEALDNIQAALSLADETRAAFQAPPERAAVEQADDDDGELDPEEVARALQETAGQATGTPSNGSNGQG